MNRMARATGTIVTGVIVLFVLAGAGPSEAAGARCREELVDGGAHTSRTRAPINVMIANRSAGVIRVYWLDPRGARILYNTLSPGASYVQQTFVGHPWVVTNMQEDCIRIYYPQPYNPQLVIG